MAVLSHGNQAQTRRAVASAKRQGLAVHVGLTAGDLADPCDTGAQVHRIPWQDDFSRARNDLLEQIDADYVLWLDSDEWLVAAPSPGSWRYRGPLMTVLFQYRQDFTPVLARRLHRHGSGLVWAGKVHERIVAEAGGRLSPQTVPFCPVVIGHDGYDDPGCRAEKARRNFRLALPGLESGSPDAGELLSLAHWETGPSRFSAITWLRLYRRALEPPQRHDHAASAARMLCAAGYPGPARKLLELRPAMVRLRLTLMADELRQGRARFATVASLLEAGFGACGPDFNNSGSLARSSLSGFAERSTSRGTQDARCLGRALPDAALAELSYRLSSGCFDPEDPVPIRWLGAGTEACRRHVEELAAARPGSVPGPVGAIPGDPSMPANGSRRPSDRNA